MKRALALVVFIGLVACGSNDQPEPPPPPTPPVPIDAAPDGITTIGAHDPSAAHLDEGGTPRPNTRPKNRPSRPIDIMLRSTPSGATVAVDNVEVGVTPTYWFGESDGKEHEFTFRLKGYALGRYRFVPITSGIVHARLDAIVEPVVDAGVAPPSPQPKPQPRPQPEPPAPPPTVLSPDAAPTEKGPQP